MSRGAVPGLPLPEAGGGATANETVVVTQPSLSSSKDSASSRYIDIKADTPHARWLAASSTPSLPTPSFLLHGSSGLASASPAVPLPDPSFEAWYLYKRRMYDWRDNMRRVLATTTPLGVCLSRDEWMVVVSMLHGATELELQRLALGTLFAHTHGENWRFKCNMRAPEDTPQILPHLNAFGSGNLHADQTGRICKIALQRNNLKGRLPSEVGLLRGLIAWDTSNNRLTGPIPHQLGLLQRLTTIKLERNKHTGPLPKGLIALTELQTFHAHYNQLTAEIPSSIGHATSLRDLQLQCNRFTGSLPTELGLCTALKKLDVSENRLNGSIPTELGCLENLTIFRAQINRLEGLIPRQIATGMRRVVELDVARNCLTGPLPAEIGTWTKLKVFCVNRNQLTGKLPSQLGNLRCLVTLNMGDNNFSGEIPAEMSQLESLSRIYLQNNPLLLQDSAPASILALL